MPARRLLLRPLTCLVIAAAALGAVVLPVGAATTLPTPRVPWNRSMDCEHADATVYRCATDPTVYDTTPAFHAYSDQATHQALDFRFEIWPGHQANPTRREVDVVVANRPSRSYVDFTDTTPLPAGDHQWRVQACLHSQPRNCSQFSTFLPFVVDTRNPFTIAPSSPFNRGVLCSSPVQPGPHCAANPTRYTRPALTAIATQVRNQNLTYNFEVYASHAAAPTNLEASGSVPLVAGGDPATFIVGTELPDGDHEWRVQACVAQYPDNCSGWSTYLPFSVDSQAPDAPVLTPSSPADTDPGTSTATVGRTVETVTIAPASAGDGVAGYAYSLAAGSNPPFGNGTCLPTPTVGFVCPAQPDQPLTISFSPLDVMWTLTVYAFDAAGNLSGRSTLDFYAGSDQGLHEGHAWTPATATGACNQTPVSDTSNRTGPTPATPLTTYSASTCAKPGVTLESGEAGTAWSLAGNGYVRTSAPSVDTSTSFSVGATVQTRPTLSTTAETVLSQDGTAQSGFILGRSGTQWRFCMPRADQARATYDCAIGGTVQPGQWTRLAGAWDAANHQLRLYVGPSLIATTPHDSSPKTTYGFLIGADKVNQRGEYFSGYAYRAFAVPGTPTLAQLAFLEAGTFFAG